MKEIHWSKNRHMNDEGIRRVNSYPWKQQQNNRSQSFRNTHRHPCSSWHHPDMGERRGAHAVATDWNAKTRLLQASPHWSVEQHVWHLMIVARKNKSQLVVAFLLFAPFIYCWVDWVWVEWISNDVDERQQAIVCSWCWDKQETCKHKHGVGGISNNRWLGRKKATSRWTVMLVQLSLFWLIGRNRQVTVQSAGRQELSSRSGSMKRNSPKECSQKWVEWKCMSSKVRMWCRQVKWGKLTTSQGAKTFIMIHDGAGKIKGKGEQQQIMTKNSQVLPDACMDASCCQVRVNLATSSNKILKKNIRKKMHNLLPLQHACTPHAWFVMLMLLS